MATFRDRLNSFFVGDREPVKPTQQQGSPGFIYYGGYLQTDETNNKLIGMNRWQTAADILRNVSMVGASVQFMTNIVSRPQWTFSPAEEDSKEAQDYADLMDDILHDMGTSWTRIVRRASMYRYHGFNLHEWTTKKREDGYIGIANLYARPVRTVKKWDLDDHGTIKGVVQTNPNTSEEQYIPRGKLLYLVADALSDSPEGLGWFRMLVDPCEALKSLLQLERIGYERDLRGIPVGRAPVTQINEMVQKGKLTRQQADDMVSGLKDFVGLQRKAHDTGLILDSKPYFSSSESGETASAVMQWGMELLTGEAGSLEELGMAVKRLQYDIALIMGTEVLLTGREGEGSRALSEDKSRNLYLSANSILTDMAEAVDRDVVDVIWSVNGFPEEMKPTATVEDVSFQDAKMMAEALSEMATAGAILDPEDPAFNEIRELLGLSPAPPIDREMMAAMQGKPEAPDGDGKDPPDDDPDGGGDDPTGDREQSKKAFDPNQPRDEDGRWTDGGAANTDEYGVPIPDNFLTDEEMKALALSDDPDKKAKFDEERKRREDWAEENWDKRKAIWEAESEAQLPDRPKLEHADSDELKFLRFGDIPEGEISRVGNVPSAMHAFAGVEAGQAEGGVSVFAANYDAAKNRWDIDSGGLADSGYASAGELLASQDEFHSEMTSGGWYHDKDRNGVGWVPPISQLVPNRNLRPIYLVTGYVVGEGLDGEPLLRNVRTLSKLGVQDVMHRGYFDPDEDINPRTHPSAFGNTKKFDPNQPRDEDGKWTDGSWAGGTDWTPERGMVRPEGLSSYQVEQAEEDDKKFESPVLDDELRHALEYYSNDGFRDVDLMMRDTYNREFPDEVEDAAHNMQKAFETQRTREAISVYRGIQVAMIGDHNRDGLFDEGEVLQDDGFMSATMGSSVATEFARAQPHHAAILKINVPEGASAIYMHPGRSAHAYEREVLLRPSRMRVTRKLDKGLAGYDVYEVDLLEG